MLFEEFSHLFAFSAFYHKEFSPRVRLVLNWISFTGSAGAFRLIPA